MAVLRTFTGVARTAANTWRIYKEDLNEIGDKICRALDFVNALYIKVGGTTIFDAARNATNFESITMPAGKHIAMGAGSKFGYAAEQEYVDEVALTDNVVTPFITIALADGEYVSGQLLYAIYCTDGVDHQANSGVLTFAAVNKAAAYTSDLDVTGASTACSGGSTLVDAFTVTTGASLIQLNIQSNTSLGVPTTFKIAYKLILHSANAVTLL